MHKNLKLAPNGHRRLVNFHTQLQEAQQQTKRHQVCVCVFVTDTSFWLPRIQWEGLARILCRQRSMFSRKDTLIIRLVVAKRKSAVYSRKLRFFVATIAID